MSARGLLLVAPLLGFLLLVFVAPVAGLLWRGVQDADVAPALPRTLAVLRAWDGHALPPDAAFVALAQDLPAARDAGSLARAAARLNDDTAGLRSVLMGSGRALSGQAGADARAALLAADPAWGRVETWGAIRRAAGPITDDHLLEALDLRRDPTGAIRPVPAEQALFRGVFGRSFAVAGLVTGLCLALGYPLAALLARLRPRLAGLLMIAVLLPFWTGVIVRTAAWLVLLARNGVVNQALLALHLIREPLPLLYSRIAVVLAMTHILLPFAVLPLYAAMRQIPRGLMRAAAASGASPLQAFWRVWLPQTRPGIGAAGLLVFVQALGFYVTPAVLGGGGDQLLPYFIGFYANRTLNWGLAAALSLLLLAGIAVLGVLWGRVVGARLAL